MHFDLLTLYALAVGTLLVSAGMTLWECHARPQRARELRILAAGYATMAIGCAAVTMKAHLPGVLGAAISNILIMTGYLLVLNGVALFRGRGYRTLTAGMLAGLVLLWALLGLRWQAELWAYVTAFPIAVVSGLTAREAWHGDRSRRLRSRHVVAAVTGCHALFYAFRSCILPLLVAMGGETVLSIAAKLTMYEGVLYSVCLPMAVLALVREEAHAQLLEVSHTDYLTGLGTRRWFFEEGARLIDAGGRRPMALLVFDLDHFKGINDRYGHATGDEMLKAFARIVRATAGGEALLGRIGGEEFAAILPGHDGQRGRAIGQAVARRFAAAMVRSVDGGEVRTTVSIGLAAFDPADQPDLTRILSAADRALYAAKALGRNRIELAQPGALADVA